MHVFRPFVVMYGRTNERMNGMDERESITNKRIHERLLSSCQMLPKAMVDRLAESAHTASAFLFFLSVFSTQVDVSVCAKV